MCSVEETSFESSLTFDTCEKIARCVTMTIEDDMLVEDDKTFTILLTNATEIYNITLEGGTLNIIENEGTQYESVAYLHQNYQTIGRWSI